MYADPNEVIVYRVMMYADPNEVIVYRVMMYADPLLTVYAGNYTKSVLHICLL